MLLTLAICHKDHHQAADLLRWMAELGTDHSRHTMLLVFAHEVAESDRQAVIAAGQRCGFKSLLGQALQHPDPRGWPRACNEMFRATVQWVKSNARMPFLWLEPDAIPVKADWIDQIEHAYAACGKPFMGTVYAHPFPHINGVMVYPPNPAKYNPSMLVSAQPWDTVNPALMIRHACVTPLIMRSLAVPEKNEPHHFPTQESLNIIPERVALFHGCKDGSLIRRLREKRQQEKRDTEIKREAEHFNPYAFIRRKVRALLRMGSSYYHSGNLGDVVYGLYAIKLHGGGELYIGPEQRGTSPCGNPISKSQFEAFKPLLELQPYLNQVRFTEQHPNGTVNIDLNVFRNHWNNWKLRQQFNLHTLCRMHCYTLGVGHLFHDNDPWLVAGEPIWHGKIIVQRSARYHSGKVKHFPWKAIVERYGKDMLFVGLEQEHKDFETFTGRKVSFWKVANLLEMANLIAGAKCCVMNQSFPLSVALGLGQRAIVEEWNNSPDCRFKRESYLGHLQGDVLRKLEEWL